MKKLKLNKETIARLNDEDLGNVRGGEEWFKSRFICFTIIKYETCACTESCIAPICIPLPSDPNCIPD